MVIACLLATAVVSGCAVAVPTAGAPPLRYVALGDSYSAGSGIEPIDLDAPLECLRSAASYPHVIAATVGARLTDVTCRGARTTDFFVGQYPGVAPQLDAVAAGTQLVTMTIGGNDSGLFVDALLGCIEAALRTLGQGSPCRDEYGSRFEDTVRAATYPALVRVLRAVRDKAPAARVAILGYPWILPPRTGCFPQMPIASGDVPYLYHLEQSLNDAIRRAATTTGATYVDMGRVSAGHDACRPEPDRWVEPVLFGTNPVVVHPNARGEAGMAAQALAVLHLR